MTAALVYFNAKGQEPAPLGTVRPIVPRGDLAQYGENLYDLVHEAVAYGGKVDWRFGR